MELIILPLAKEITIRLAKDMLIQVFKYSKWINRGEI